MNTHGSNVSLLGPRGRPALLRHFMALGTEDRRLRFGHPINDTVLANYVANLDLSHDGLFVVRDARRRIVGAVHVALNGSHAEAGLSVLPRARGQGLGSRLFNRAAQFARDSGATRIDMHFLSENRAIQHIAVKSGMRIVSHAGESEAYLLIPAADAPASAPDTAPTQDDSATAVA